MSTTTVATRAPLPPLLSEVHAHPRDARIRFEEEGHAYFIDGDPTYTSVTTHIHGAHFEHFDAPAVIRRMMRSPKWATSKYHGMSAEAIAAQWERNGRESSALGTRLHECIEDFYNGRPPADDRLEGIRTEYCGHFLSFHEEYAAANDYVPYRTEWCVFDEEHKLAGSIDMVYARARGGGEGGGGGGGEEEELAIFDWKRTKELKRRGFRCGRGALSGLPDCNFWHYAMQLNTYRWILQRRYGKRVTRLALVVLHPNQASYRVVEVPLLDDLVDGLMAERRAALRGEPPPPAVAADDDAACDADERMATAGGGGERGAAAPPVIEFR